MRNIPRLLILSAAFLSPFAPLIAPAEENAHRGALVEEMHRLDASFREIVSAVALGDGARVARAIEDLHGAREKTEEALHAGEITLPKNPDKAELFKKLDHEFHTGLKALSHAAVKGNRAGMVSATQRLLGQCAGCHRVFRK